MGSCDLTKDVRRTLVKAWLNMGKVRLQIAGRTVIVRGRLVKSRDDDDPVNGMFIEDLENKVRGIKGVKFVRWALEDWKVEKGQWVRSEAD